MVPPEVQIIHAHAFLSPQFSYLSARFCNVCPTNSPGAMLCRPKSLAWMDAAMEAAVTDHFEEQQHDLEYILESATV
jgi:hypothetical protein